jgi:hypothetical protein
MSKNVFSTLTIDGVKYVIDDKTKLSKPINDGSAGQVLTKTATGTEWQTISTDRDYVLQEEFEEVIGNINAILDELNGEVV